MGTNRGHIPIRTCISCGTKRSKRELLRIVVDPKGFVIRDIAMKAKGRGAYVCPNTSCFERVKSGNRLNRAFSREVFVAKDF